MTTRFRENKFVCPHGVKRLESTRRFSTMIHVLKSGRMLGCLLLLAGCSSSPRQPGARVPDWNAAGETEGTATEMVPVADAPPIAPPPPAASPRSSGETNRYAETWIPLGRWSREHNVG